MKRILFLLIVVSIYSSCSDDSNETEQIQEPEIFEINVTMVGANKENMQGDGNGVVYLEFKVRNANRVMVFHEGTEIPRNYGNNFEYTFIAEKPGIHFYEVEVLAENVSTNQSSTKLIRFEVLKIYKMPDLLYQILVLDKKQWRIEKEVDNHVMMDPANSDSTGYGTHPDESKYANMYDDTYLFGFQSMVHETNGEIVGKINPLKQDFGVISETPNKDEEYENYPLESYTTSWMYSPWGLHMDGKGFIGSYVGGNHVYEMMWITRTHFLMRTIGADGNYWYFKLTSE